MSIKPITIQDKNDFNKVVHHPLQTYEWGEFRKETGVKVIRRGVLKDNKLVDGFQLTIHPIPRTPWTIGYLPKGTMPTEAILQELQTVGEEERCVFIQLEPNIVRTMHYEPGTRKEFPESKEFNTIIHNSSFIIHNSAHPLFTKYTFHLDLTKSEEELLKAMHPKTRYNIKVAQKNGVEVTEDSSTKAFEVYWKLMEETTTRQKFYAHGKSYHQSQWELFPHEITHKQSTSNNQLSSHLLTATYQGKILTAMLFFVFHDTLYYPYGASSGEYRNFMHSTLTMWEGIRFGKKLGLKTFDMWGALGPHADQNDPWFGFHDFKRKYGPDHVEFVGSYDLIIKPQLYQAYKLADKLRWVYLKLRK